MFAALLILENYKHLTLRFMNAAVYNMERLKTEFNALNKAIGVKRKVSQQ